MRRVLVLIVMAAACGGSDGGGPIPIDDLPEAFTSSFCNLYVECGLVEDHETCRDVFADPGADADLYAAVDAGKVRYHPDKARECLNAFAAIGCARDSLETEQPAACADTFEGTVAEGGQCAIDEACISQVCDVPSCPDACCQGTCAPPQVRPRAGESCATNPDCVDSYCDEGTTTCAPLKAYGQFCASSDECAQGTCSNQVCTKLPAPGEACMPSGTFTLPCSHLGYTCSTTTMTCVEYGLTGDPCTATRDCSPVYQCGTAGTCELRPTVGDPCGTQTSTGGCIGASYCDPGTMICTALKAEGAACATSNECQSENCDPVTNKCAADPVCI